MKLRHICLLLLASAGQSLSCAPITNPLSLFSVSVTGNGTYSSTSGPYFYANSSGAVVSSSNSIQVAFSDSFLPLYLYSYNSIFADQLVTGSCSSLGSLVAAVNNNVVSTSFSATGCTDQSTVSISMDTTQVFDQQGYNGWDLVSFLFTIDVAPKVISPATGNTAADGSGTNEASSGVFTLTGNLDSSIVVTFSKALSSQTLSGALTGCAATLGTPVLVVSSNSTTTAWPLGNLGGVSVGQSCTLNVSGNEDTINNPEDPADPNISMSFTFH